MTSSLRSIGEIGTGGVFTLLPHPFTYLVRRFRSEARIGWPLAAIPAAT
jgi:hypothetical protein